MTLSGDDPTQSSPESDFRIWVNRWPRGNTLRRAGVVVKSGAQVMKTVELSHYGDPETAEVRKRELRYRTFDKRKSYNIDFDTTDPKNTWFCENNEIERLLAFLHSDVARTGRYQVVDTDSPETALLELLETNEVDAQALVDALVRNCNVEQIFSLLANNDRGLSAAQAAVVGRRRERVARLRQLVDNPASTETQVQGLIGNAYWIFGGRYVGVAERRSLTMLDQYDIPLLGSDGTLHIVELKGPSIEHLITWHRNHWIAGPEVHRSASQAMSYLRSLDEDGLGLSKKFENELGQHYDMSRVFATVVIGHSDHHRPARAARDVVARTLRQYNAGLNRVEVITYDQLVESAERALAFEHDANNPLPQAPQPADDPLGSADSEDPWRLPQPASSWDDEPPF